jgi:hypothetical protein
LTTLMKSAFGLFFKTTSSGNFMEKANEDSDEAKSLKWLAPLGLARIVVCNEAKIATKKNPNVELSGYLLKMLTGRDAVEYRKLFQIDNTESVFKATFMFFANEFPTITSSDACDTLESFNFKNQFVNDAKRRDIEIEIGVGVGELPDTYMDSDTEISNWIKGDDVIDAFIMAVFQNYNHIRRPMPASMALEHRRHMLDTGGQSVANDPKVMLLKFVKNGNGPCVHTSDIIEHLANMTENRCKLTSAKMNTLMTQCNLGQYCKSIRINGKQSPGYRQIILHCPNVTTTTDDAVETTTPATTTTDDAVETTTTTTHSKKRHLPAEFKEDWELNKFRVEEIDYGYQDDEYA